MCVKLRVEQQWNGNYERGQVNLQIMSDKGNESTFLEAFLYSPFVP